MDVARFTAFYELSAIDICGMALGKNLDSFSLRPDKWQRFSALPVTRKIVQRQTFKDED
jgi:hypothetical protein